MANGNEFLGPEFVQILSKTNILSVRAMVKNPQSNAMVGRLHQTLNTTIIISLQEDPPKSFKKYLPLSIESVQLLNMLYVPSAIVNTRYHLGNWPMRDKYYIPLQGELIENSSKIVSNM